MALRGPVGVTVLLWDSTCALTVLPTRWHSCSGTLRWQVRWKPACQVWSHLWAAESGFSFLGAADPSLRECHCAL